MRLPDWPQRLSKCIDVARSVPFAFVAHDCCTFADDCVMATTGESRMGDLRGSYAGSIGASRLIRQHGGLRAAVIARLGPCASRARRGDVVMFISSGREALGVCIGSMFAAPGEHGLLFFPIGKAEACWEID